MAATDRLELRPIAGGELPAYLRALQRAFGEEAADEAIERFRAVAEPDRFLAAFDTDGAIVGTAGAFSFDISLPGGTTAPCAGVTLVSVRPDHRRRGLFSRMMAELLDRADVRGEPFAALWASESGIYGRFGFGPAIPTVQVELNRDRSAFREQVELDVDGVRIVDADQALGAFPPLYERLRSQRAGMLSRSAAWWRRRFGTDPKDEREGAGPRMHALVDGRGYAAYRLAPSWADDLTPDGTVVVEELVATDPQAHASLWRFVLDTDLSARTRANGRPVDEVLPLIAAEPAHVRVAAAGPVYLRLVDLPAALSSRSYAADDRLVIEVQDRFRPRDAGRWVLEVDAGEAVCGRSEREPDLVIDTRDLAAVALGGERVSRLVAAGLVACPTAGAAARLDRLLAGELAPWHTGMF